MVSERQDGWFAVRFARLSTGFKMLLILSLGLLPLGLIAILASIESARGNSIKNEEEVAATLDLNAQRIDAALGRAALSIRAAGSAIEFSDADATVCDRTLGQLVRAQGSQWRYALFGRDGGLRCASPGYTPPRLPFFGLSGSRSVVELSGDREALRFVLVDADGGVQGAGEFSRASLERIALVPGAPAAYDLELVDGRGQSMLLHDGYRGGRLTGTVSAAIPVIGDRMELRIRTAASSITAAEVLIILLPVMMWLFAAGVGWVIVDRLLLKPLLRMQRAVAAYQPGDRQLDLPLLSTPAREIGDLGYAFHRVTQTVARHEAELEAGLDRQTRLVREVHHRVKNNLQVVSSLIALHARGAGTDDVAAAYAAIQRRVDALSVVHRNHFAQFEDNRGVSLKSLISELCANLRATAAPSASDIQIRLDVAGVHATQDVAVSVAFLLTEVVEFAMLCGGGSVAICVDRKAPGVAGLLIESDSLKAGVECAEPGIAERFERIVTGLSRQLRSTINRDPDTGRYALEIAILEKGDDPDPDRGATS